MEEEIWREVEENPDYKISNKNGWYNTKRKQYPYGSIKRGYRCVTIGRDHTKPYHVLVAKAFPEICGEWFDGAHVHHKDFDKLNNVPENLIVLTNSEHQKLHYAETTPDSFKKPTEKRAKGISKGRKGCKYSEEGRKKLSKAFKGRKRPEIEKPVLQFTLDGEFVKRWDSAKQVFETTGWHNQSICRCCMNKPHFNTAYGYIWRYEKEVDD